MLERPRRPAGLAAALLALCLLFSGSALAQTRLMVATDLHYLSPSLFGGSELFLRSLQAGDGKMTQYSAEILEALAEEAIGQKPDALLLTGDLTYNGERQSHEELSQTLGRVADAGIPVLTIPGNHDINNIYAYAYQGEEYSMTDRETEGHYKRHYWPYGLENALYRDDTTYSYAYAISSDLWCVMLDVSVYIDDVISAGYVTPETLQWLRGVLEEAKKADVAVVTATHQSLLQQTPVYRTGYGIYEGEALAALLREYGVRLNLSGHIHILHHVSEDGLTDAATSALSVSPHRYAMVTLEDDGSLTYEAIALERLPQDLAQASAAEYLANSARKAANALSKIPLADDEREKMVAFAAQVNRAYFAGTVYLHADQWLEDEAYTLWQKKGSQSSWRAYLESMLKSGAENMTRFSVPAP